MITKIKFENGHVYEPAPNPVKVEPSLFGKRVTQNGEIRECERYTIYGNYDDIKADFVDGAKYSVSQLETKQALTPHGQPVYDEDNQPVIVEYWQEYDKSHMCFAGDITDHRNGSFSVYMTGKSDKEKQLDDILAIVRGETVFDDETGVDTYADNIKSQIQEHIDELESQLAGRG